MGSLGLFNTKTTYQNDFIPYKIQPKVIKPKIYYDPLERQPSQRQLLHMDLETLRPFSIDTHIPSDLCYHRKQCAASNPQDKIPIVKLEDKIFEEKLKVRKTRPRVYLVPQISLDDVPEDVMYGENGLAANIYTSDWKQYTDIVKAVTECKNPSSTSKAKAESGDDILTAQKGMDSVRFKPPHPCLPMDVGLKKFVRDWDRYQTRAIVDKNKTFWKRNRSKGLCSICEGLDARINLPEDEKKEIREALADDLVRSPYALFAPGYCGYTPKVPVGIGVRKKLFKKYEPYVTSLMEVQGVYLKSSTEECH